MKRTIPLLITALGGFVLLVAYFIPATQGWGELAAIWFDVLAAIAFVLGGGNLIMIHLKKTSERSSGWGYSVITLLSFLGLLYVGLVKWGSPPAPNQEKYGQAYVSLSLDSIPVLASVSGSLPVRPDEEKIHPSVRSQFGEANGEITFRGWMTNGQKTKLLGHRDHLDWQCSVERLYKKSQPQSDLLKGRVGYNIDHRALSFKGNMTEEQRDALLGLEGNEQWAAAVNELYDATQATTEALVGVDAPPFLDVVNPGTDLSYDAITQTLSVTGPMTTGQRDGLADLFRVARPMSEGDRTRLMDQLTGLGSVEERQKVAFRKVLDGSWTVEQLRELLDEAGKAQEEDRSACEMLADQEAGVENIELKKTEGEDQILNKAQVGLLVAFVSDGNQSVDDLLVQLKEAGPFSGAQAGALSGFMSSSPTVGERNRTLCFVMMKVKDTNGRRLTLNTAQSDLLLEDYRQQVKWRRAVGDLFIASHAVKFPWSGEYRAQGTPFWWLYEYAFKPLQATIFSMLAFYVASAAFRAFRAKNFEATLLLATAFIILLGRTFAGVWLTSWMPEMLEGLKIENMTVTIMKVFNTAGNRAIMIGIALGIASTSLKVLLGIDRSYLGSGED